MVAFGVNSQGHNYNTYRHQIQLGLLASRTKDAAHVIRSTGFDATCGCICCKNSAIVCLQPPFLPEGMQGVLTLDEFNQLCHSLNEVFTETVVPAFPCFLCHLCIPFSPMCAIMYYQSQRRSGVKRVCEEFNQRVLKSRGAYLEPFMELDYIAALRVDRAAHHQYLVASGILPQGAIYSATPPQQIYAVPQAGHFGPGSVVPVGQPQYASVPQYAPVGTYGNSTVVPVMTAEFVQPVGVTPMSMDKR